MFKLFKHYKDSSIYSDFTYGSNYKCTNNTILNTFYPERPMFLKRSSTKNSQKQNNIVYDSKIMFSLLGIKLEDGFLETHSNQVSVYCHELGKALGVQGQELKELELAGLLHDVGKSYIPKDIINKPGKLTESEWKIIKAHSNIGFEILNTVKEYSNLAKYARYHHERIDGSGYPEGLKGEEIPLPSRIICVVDAYEAMTEDRPYRKAMTKSQAIAELRNCSGTQFDKTIVDIFVGKVLNKNTMKNS